MSDTRTLLDRITSFRERLERTQHLIPDGTPVGDLPAVQAEAALALARQPDLLSHSLRTLTGEAVAVGLLPPRLTARARRALEDARGLVEAQRRLTGDPLVAGLSAVAAVAPGDDPDPIVVFQRDTVALTESALRMVQAFPASADVQVRMCDGLEVMLRAVRDRLTVAEKAVAARRTETDRVDGLARRMADLAAGRVVDLQWFAELAEQIVEDARQAAPVRFLSADPHSTSSYPGGPQTPAPARFVAAHALTVAQVVARVAPHDFEWATRPIVPVLAALLMDVGMLRVPADALAAAGPLDADARRLVDGHATAGADLLRRLFPEAGPIADAIAAHHERPDGTGYPDGLAGEQIPSLARLLAVCDFYAAMAADRPHRPAKDPRTALTDALLAAENGRLDRDFTEYLVNLSFHPVGTVVELTDGRVGVVVANHTGRTNLRATGRPVVAVLTDSHGAVLSRPEHVDLAAAQRGGIVRVLPDGERNKLLARYYPELCG